MAHFGIANKLIRLTKATMENSNYYVKIGTIMTDGFKIGTGLKQGDGLAPNLFNIALEYVIRQLSIQTTSTKFHKSVKLIGYADDMNIMDRTKRAISDVYVELKERVKEIELIIKVDKTKAMVQNRRLGKGGTLTVEDHKIDVVRRFKFLGTVITDNNDETEEIRVKILGANKAYSSLQTLFLSKQIHRNNKIRLYKTLIKPILCYGSVTWTLTQTAEQMLNTFERKILRRIYGPTQEGGRWRPRWNRELYSLYNEDIKNRRLGWAGHVIRVEEERIPKKGFKRKLLQHKTSGKTKKHMGGCSPEGCITAAGVKRIEEKN